MRGDDCRYFSVGNWFGQEPFSTIRGVARFMGSSFSVKPFWDGLVWHYHCFTPTDCTETKNIPEHRLGSETVTYN